ncbi:MAG: peptidoglycan-binding protein [Actinomycetota bacterium]
MLRGDDVADLQQSLNQIGFDCGRPDGIMGPATSRALEDFQRNAGVMADGICGSQTVRVLRLMARQSGSGPGVANLREEESARLHASMRSQRIVVGQFGGLSALGRSLARALRERGATVISTDEYEAAAQAAAANRFGASLYIGFEARVEPAARIAYFAVPAFESLGGRALATELATTLRARDSGAPDVVGMRLPVLRETRMPAVLCSWGPVRDVVARIEPITHGVVDAITSWSETPVSDVTVPGVDPAR